jgi:hypothetical protein
VKIGTLAAIAALLASGGTAATPPPGDGFPAFWHGFAAAAKKPDTAALASMTVLGAGLSDATTFPQFYRETLKPHLRCLAGAHPIYGKEENGHGEYTAFCGQLIFVFTRTAAGWRLTDISPDD